MIISNDTHKDNIIENNKKTELLINNNLSSGEKRIINTQNKSPTILVHSSNSNSNLQKNNSKRKIKINKINHLPLSNYSFSNIASGKELSKEDFESLEKETLDLDEDYNKKCKKFTKKDVPVYVNHSDYYYCPNSKKEKNLNIQIMNYLYQNNLIKNKINNTGKNIKNNKKKKNNSFKLENKIKIKNDNKTLINKNELIFIRKIKDQKNNLINNNDKIIDSEQTDYSIQNHIKQIKKNTINNIKIKYVNNINNNIYRTESRNNIDKPKEIFYTFRTGKIMDNNNEIINKTEVTLSNNIINNISYKNKKLIPLEKKTKKNIMKRNIIPIAPKKNNCKNNGKKKVKEKYNHSNYEISSNVINEKFIDNNNNKKNKKENNSSCDISRISLQSINDSKMLELAENFIPKDEELERFKANEILKKRNKSKKEN